MKTSGVLIVNKPPGPTSHDIVTAVRRALPVTSYELRAPRVGHAGTLDPFASGVLVVAVGSAVRLLEYTGAWEKQYRAELQLGASSDTGDRTGTITPHPGPRPPSRAELEDIVRHFRGRQLQTPPAYSAVKVGGQKLYRLARAGRLQEAAAKAASSRREITIHSLDIISYEYPRLEISVTCSGGTYIRALARDIGEALGTGAYVAELCRTAVGHMKLSDAISLSKLNPKTLLEQLLPPKTLVQHLPSLTLSDSSVAQLKQGQGVGEKRALPPKEPIALFDEDNNLFGIGQYHQTEQVLSPQKIIG